MATELPGQRGDSITPTMEPQQNSSSLDSSGNEKQQFEGVNTKVPYVTWRSMVLATFVSMGGILFGYDTGQISGFLAMSNYKMRYGIPRGNGEYYFTDVRSGLIVGLLAIGTLMGALCGAPLADYFGRKYTISIWCLVMIVGLIVQISTPADVWYQMVIGRWVTGLGVGGCSLLVPMYQGESAPRHIRGAIICCYQLFITLGIFLSYCINLGTYTMEGTAQWRITLGITFLFAIVLGVGMIFFPESPRYDFRYGRVDSARSTVSKLYGVPENHQTITQEFHEIREQLEAEHAKDKKWHEFFTDTRMFYRLVLGMVLQSLQQLTGANYFFYYGTVIFKGAGLENSFITQVILGAVNFGTTFGGLYVVENFGRRKSLMTGAFLMFVFFMVFASVGHFVLDVEQPQNTPGAGKAMIVVGCLFVATYAMTWGPMIWAITAEIYPPKHRSLAMALSTAANWCWNFLIGFFTPFITSAIDFAYGYVFAGCMFVGIFIVYFFLVESNNRTLEEVDWMYTNKILPWKSSSFQVPWQWASAEDPADQSRKNQESVHNENA